MSDYKLIQTKSNWTSVEKEKNEFAFFMELTNHDKKPEVWTQFDPGKLLHPWIMHSKNESRCTTVKEMHCVEKQKAGYLAWTIPNSSSLVVLNPAQGGIADR